MSHPVTVPIDTSDPVVLQALRESLTDAEGWAEYGISPESQAYWSGMRDTLRVVLGVRTEAPRLTGPGQDNAAAMILGAQARARARKKG